MRDIDRLQAKNIDPKYWPPIDERGNIVSHWRGRARECQHSFSDFWIRAGNSNYGRIHLNIHHVAK